MYSKERLRAVRGSSRFLFFFFFAISLSFFFQSEMVRSFGNSRVPTLAKAKAHSGPARSSFVDAIFDSFLESAKQPGGKRLPRSAWATICIFYLGPSYSSSCFSAPTPSPVSHPLLGHPSPFIFWPCNARFREFAKQALFFALRLPMRFSSSPHLPPRFLNTFSQPLSS